MLSFILWLIALVAHFVYIFPPLWNSERPAAQAVRSIAAAVSGAALGAGLSNAFFDMLAK